MVVDGHDADEDPDGVVAQDTLTRCCRRLVADPETAVAEAVANARLSGRDVSPEGLAAMRAVANGELTVEQAIAQRIAALTRAE